jgi:methionine biosynthesis protein MetW
VTELRRTYERYWTDRLATPCAPAAEAPNEILESIEPLLPAGIRLLDVGCGDGFVFRVARARFQRVFGCDVALAALRRAQRAGMRTVCADLAGSLPYEDGAFDCITCLEVIEHVADPLHLLTELRRVLKSGGTLIITTPNIRYFRHVLTLLLRGRFPHTTTDTFVWGGGHFHYFTRADLQSLVERAGFIHCRFALAMPQFTRSWKRRWLAGLLGPAAFGEWICGGITAAAVRP